MEISDWAVLGLFGVCLVLYVTRSIGRIEEILNLHVEKLNEKAVDEFDFSAITETIEGIVEDMLENIHLPTPGDMMMQMGLQFMANKFGLGPGAVPFVEEEPDVDILQPPSE